MLCNQEIKRKILHISSLWIPLGIYYYGKQNMLWILSAICIIWLVGELLRQHYFPYHQLINKVLDKYGLANIMRAHEKKGGLSGATYMLLAACFCLLVYSNVAVILGFLILITADSAAAIIGKKYGTHTIIKLPTRSKTLQGTLAFLVVALIMYVIVAFVLFRLPLSIHIACILAVCAATAAELFAITIGVDDNMAAPIACCATYELSIPILTYLI